MSFRKMGTKITITIFGFILLIPIAAYGYQFGIGIWDSHDDWAKMGSALGGIYAPILSILTLYVIYRQLRLQAVIHVDQMDWQKLQTSRQHGLYLCEKLKEKVNDSRAYSDFLRTLENTGVDKSISKLEYLNFIGRDETSLLIHQLITLLRNLRHVETHREVRHHLKGLALTYIGAENLHEYEINMCRWHDHEYKNFSSALCVFTDQSDLDRLAIYKK